MTWDDYDFMCAVLEGLEERKTLTDELLKKVIFILLKDFKERHQE